MRDGTATRERLERCALTLFVEKGISATTIKDIANSAAIAEGTLYRHYVSKDELAQALYSKAHNEVAAEIKKVAHECPSFKLKLKAMVFFFCKKYDEDPIVFNYLLLSMHYQSHILTDKEQSAHAQIMPIFNEAIKKKEIKKRDPDFYVAIVMGIVLQAALSRVYKRITRSMLQDADDLVDAIYGALHI